MYKLYSMKDLRWNSNSFPKSTDKLILQLWYQSSLSLVCSNIQWTVVFAYVSSNILSNLCYFHPILRYNLLKILGWLILGSFKIISKLLWVFFLAISLYIMWNYDQKNIFILILLYLYILRKSMHIFSFQQQNKKC